MTSVWVIEDGSYSDYRVLGVFTTEASAARVAQQMKLDPETTVSEWPLDPGIEQLNQGLTVWTVQMKATGDVIEMAPGVRWSGQPIEDVPDVRIAQYGAERRVVASVWARDAEHAIKIVGEHRAQFRAKGDL